MAPCDGRSIETVPVTLDGCRIPGSESPTAPGRRCGSSVGRRRRSPRRPRRGSDRPSVGGTASAGQAGKRHGPVRARAREARRHGGGGRRRLRHGVLALWLRPRAGGAGLVRRRLAARALSATELRVFTAQGDLVQTVHLPSGLRAADGAFAPTGKSFAVTATKRTRTWPAERGADPQARHRDTQAAGPARRPRNVQQGVLVAGRPLAAVRVAGRGRLALRST